MTIQDNGRVGVGAVLNALDVLNVNGDLRVVSCVRNGSGTQIAGTYPSDARMKRDIRPFPKVLNKLAMLQPGPFLLGY